MDDIISNACEEGLTPQLLYKSEKLGSDQLPSSFSHFGDTPIFDQHKSPATQNACTVYGLTHDKHDYENQVSLDPAQKREQAIERGASRTQGWSMGGALRMYKQQGLISGYALAAGVDTMKRVLLEKPIYTGSNRISRTQTKAHPKHLAQILENGNGHAFEIAGWDDDYNADGKQGARQCKNSNENFPEFWVAYEDTQYLYSTIEIFLPAESVAALKAKAEADAIAVAIDKGVTNGDNPDVTCTRGQFAVMMARVHSGSAMDYDQGIQYAREKGIFNGSHPDNHIMRYEAMIMVGRVLSTEIIKTMTDAQYINLAVDNGITNGRDERVYMPRRQAWIMVGRLLKILQ